MKVTWSTILFYYTYHTIPHLSKGGKKSPYTQLHTLIQLKYLPSLPPKSITFFKIWVSHQIMQSSNPSLIVTNDLNYNIQYNFVTESRRYYNILFIDVTMILSNCHHPIPPSNISKRWYLYSYILSRDITLSAYILRHIKRLILHFQD